jgi:futalosine hydrolase
MTLLLGGIPAAELVVVHAAALEAPEVAARAVVEIGVGKVAAAIGLYGLLQTLERQAPVRGVLLCGVAGAYPSRHRRSPPPVARGAVCIVGNDVLADEGVGTESGFVDLGRPAFGDRQPLLDAGPFPLAPRMAADAAAALSVAIVHGATVSTCSGSEALSVERHQRTGADVETMEGAAVALVCRRCEVPLLHVRAISNWTGDRERGEWALGPAIDAMRLAMRRLFG